MAIDMYKGKFVTAQDASKLIDTNNINKQCMNFNDAAEKLNAIADKIQVLRNICNKDAISVDGVGMEDTIDLYEKHVRELSEYLKNLSSNIVNDSQKIINRKQIIFNEEAKEENKNITIKSELEEYKTVGDDSNLEKALDNLVNNSTSNGGDING